jgi:hypothetical protein
MNLTHPKQIQKQFTTEAQRHREKHFVLLTAPVAQLTKYKTLCLRASVVKYFLAFDCQAI